MHLRKYALASISNKFEMKHRQNVIADICGVTQAQVSKWWNIREGDKQTIPSDHLKKIAEFFNVSMEDLYNKHPANSTTA